MSFTISTITLPDELTELSDMNDYGVTMEPEYGNDMVNHETMYHEITDKKNIQNITTDLPTPAIISENTYVIPERDTSDLSIDTYVNAHYNKKEQVEQVQQAEHVQDVQHDLLDKKDLHEYQHYCIDFLLSHPVALLILEMGLGKTVITLTALWELIHGELNQYCKYCNNHALNTVAIRKVLVIAPLRVARDIWPIELNKWNHLKELSMSVVLGNLKKRIAALNKKADIYVINTDNVNWLVSYYEEHGLSWDFDAVVIDELSSFKNARSERYKALMKVRSYAKRMIGLTGTPAANGLMDLWAEVGILDGGKRLGRYISWYRNKYFRPGSMHPVTGRIYDYIPLEDAERQIYNDVGVTTPA